METGGYFGFTYYASNQSEQLGFAISIPAVLCFISLDSLFVTWALRQSYLRLQFHKRVNKTNPIDYVYLQPSVLQKGRSKAHSLEVWGKTVQWQFHWVPEKPLSLNSMAAA